LFTPAFIEAFITQCTDDGAQPADVVATATAFTAATIADQYARFLPEAPHDVLLSGGGARNTTLVRGIADAFAMHAQQGRAVPHVRLFDDVFFDPEAKEAVAFALLGYLHLTGRPGNVPSATGARAPRVLGALTPVALSEKS
jgi:anhydro-N-acetylmuramic acid kinase